MSATTNKASGKVTLFANTADEMTIDPASRSPVTMPAYRAAQLARQASATMAGWDDSAVVRLVAKRATENCERKRLVISLKNERGVSFSQFVNDDAIQQAVRDVMATGANINQKRVLSHIIARARSITREQLKLKMAREERMRKLTQEKQAKKRAISARKKLYQEYGMRVPSDEALEKELDRPFTPTKTALRRKQIESLKQSLGHS